MVNAVVGEEDQPSVWVMELMSTRDWPWARRGSCKMWDKKPSGETVLGLIWGRAMVSRRLDIEE